MEVSKDKTVTNKVIEVVRQYAQASVAAARTAIVALPDEEAPETQATRDRRHFLQGRADAFEETARLLTTLKGLITE